MSPQIDASRQRRLTVPDATSRWRCSGCGNLTRFDVVRTSTNREFWHLDLAGAPTVEEATTVSETVESVTCRWCGRDDAIEVVRRPAESGGTQGPTATT